MDNLSKRLTFDLGKKNKIFYYSQKEDPKNIFRAKYKYIQNLQTSQGYIFRILQNFATKF